MTNSISITPTSWVRRISTVVLVALTFAGCTAATEQPPGDSGIGVVATTAILGDITANLIGDEGTVEVLIPIGADPHDYQASGRQVAAIHNADLVIANGLSLEQGLLEALASAADDGANLLEVAPRVNPLPMGAFDGSIGGLDPHVWLDPARVAEVARLIAHELARFDPSIDWVGRADLYATTLHEADEQIRQILSIIPDGDRLLVSNHDSLGYFADRYEFELVGVVIGGGATLAEPSSSDLADLTSTIQRRGVRAIFADSADSYLLAEAVAAESGVAVVELHVGSLGAPGSGAETLIDMLLTNADRIATALAP